MLREEGPAELSCAWSGGGQAVGGEPPSGQGRRGSWVSWGHGGVLMTTAEDICQGCRTTCTQGWCGQELLLSSASGRPQPSRPWCCVLRCDVARKALGAEKSGFCPGSSLEDA